MKDEHQQRLVEMARDLVRKEFGLLQWREDIGEDPVSQFLKVWLDRRSPPAERTTMRHWTVARVGQSCLLFYWWLEGPNDNDHLYTERVWRYTFTASWPRPPRIVGQSRQSVDLESLCVTRFCEATVPVWPGLDLDDTSSLFERAARLRFQETLTRICGDAQQELFSWSPEIGPMNPLPTGVYKIAAENAGYNQIEFDPKEMNDVLERD